VTEPDIINGQEAKDFAKELQLVLRYLDASDADMEKGQMRVEVNVSVSDNEIFGTKVEVKNINSFANAEKAINYEIERQVKAILAGEKIVQETRGFDAVKGVTVAQRTKEGSSDYRYFPEPDIPVLDFSKWGLEKMQSEMPELPWAKRARFASEYELDLKAVEVLINNKELADYYEKICTELGEASKSEKVKGDYKKLAKLASNYLINDYLSLMWATKKDDNKWPITPENFAEFIAKVNAGEVNSASAKVVLAKMFETGADPGHLIQDLGLTQIDDMEAIAQVAQKVIQENAKSVADYKKGKENAIMFLVGALMKEMKGRAKPDIAKEALKKLLDAQ
jgi:aspartyl-tRNA(Asn)/glutamyl-tRNA(Gln) amidotransferase subunit B